MSLANFIHVIESDVHDAFGVIEKDAEEALTAIWGVARPIFTAFEPVVVNDLLGELETFLKAAAVDVLQGTPDYIATVFLATLRDTGHSLLGTAEKMGIDLLTALAALAKNSHVGG